jgi:rhodanese-related sulfurtransferase
MSIAIALSLATWAFGARVAAEWVLADHDGTRAARHAGDPLTIDITEFLSLHKNDGALVIDVRVEESYQAGHVPGAVHVSLRSLGARIDDLRARAAGRPIVAYCACPSEASSLAAARALVDQGVAARALVGGYHAWVARGGAIDTGVQR